MSPDLNPIEHPKKKRENASFPEGHAVLREAKNLTNIDSTKPENCTGCRCYGIAITLTYGGKLFICFWGFLTTVALKSIFGPDHRLSWGCLLVNILNM